MEPAALLLVERVRNNIQLGESHIREFKSAFEGPPQNKKPRPVKDLLKQIGEQLVGFANSDGGDLLVGVEDDGAIAGVPHDAEAVQGLLCAPQTHVFAGQVLPLSYAVAVELDGKRVLFFSVTKGTSQIYQLPDGRCVRRRDKECVPILFADIQFEQQEIRSREFERQFVDGASANDLDLEELQIAANSYLKGLSVERYLQQVGLSEYSPGGLRLRMAALLLFARDARRWHPRCQLRILRVLGTELGAGDSYNVKEDITEGGNIFKLLVRGWDLLRTTFLVQRTQFAEGARFETKFVYPEQACREALINAIAHRDYSVHSGIDLFVYNDRMEVRSPGALLSTIKVADLQELKGAHESRNPLIARVLREHRYMRELGEGMRRIFEAMEQNDLGKPELVSSGSSFSVVLSNRSVFNQREEEWLSLFQSYGLSRLQKRIVVAGIDGKELSPDDIYRAMNTEDRDTYDVEVTGLRKSDILAEIRSSPAAQQMSRSRLIPKSKVARFRVCHPASTKPESQDKVRRTSGPLAGPRRELFPEETGLFVGNVDPSTTEAELRAVFQRFGNVRKVIMNWDKRPGIPSKYAVLWLESADEVNRALDILYGFRLGGRELQLQRFRARDQRYPVRRADR
ncbi:MAG: ATP-binding protein [Planctomycetota bacterium]